MAMGIPSEATRIRKFWQRVQRSEGVGCWVWTGGKTVAGYGVMLRMRKVQYAHRFSYELFRGPIPVGLEIDHLCNNRACVNPDHLRAVTHLENMRRSIPGAFNAAKTHCPYGHAYTAENTYTYKGRRNCRVCIRQRRREYRRRLPM